MHTITSHTTIGQLAIQRSALGIESLTVVTDRQTGNRLATALIGERVFFGHGVTEADALEECFKQCRGVAAEKDSHAVSAGVQDAV